MFCDMVGSSALSTRLDPEEQGEVIAAFHACCASEVKALGGMVAQYLGDGVLAYFGYPTAHENDAERAILAGLAIIKAVEALKTAAGDALQTRIGIGSGVVVVGDLMRGGVTQENAAIGETTNLVARLQGIAEPNSLVISPLTHRLVGALFDYRDLGRHALKGFPESVHVRQVLGVSKVESRFEAQHQSGTSPLLGRQEELDLLLRQWDEAKRGKGRVVLLTGEPGIGKSRMASTLSEQLRSDPHIPLSYFCSPLHQGSALYPFIGQITRAAGIERDESTEVKLDKLQSLLAQSSGNHSTEMPLFAALLSIPGGDRYPLPEMTPQRRKERTLEALLDQVKHLAVRRTILMLFEDLHWIDPTSLELLSLAIEQISSQRLLLLATARPEFTPPWPRHPHISSISLNRLGRSDGKALILDITKAKPLPAEVRDQIIGRTDGVPLFIEELTKTVLESGFLRDVGDHYELAGPLPPLAIPSTLHASLLARLDRLSAVKDVAQIGAVIGREFTYPLIAAAAALPEQRLRDALSQLVTAELIYQQGVPPDATYQFKHALVQDASYASLVRSRRRQLHGAVARALEEGFADIVATEPETVAHHLTEAGLTESALSYWRKAGQLASARSANREAVKFFEQALAVLQALPESQSTLEQAFIVRLEQRPVLSHLGEVRQTRERLSEAAALAGKLNDDRRLGRVLALMTNNHSLLGELDEALAVGSRALGIARLLGDLELSILAKSYLAHADYHRGQYERVVELITDNLAMMPVDRGYEFFGLSAPASIYNRFYLVVSLAELGRFAEAAEYEAEALRLAESQSHYTVGLASYAAGTRHLLEGDWPKALARFEHAIAVYRAGNIFLQLHTAVASSAWARAQLCEASEALNRLRECEPLLQRAVSREIVGTRGLTYHSLGRTCLLLGRLDEAHRLGHRALESSPCHPGFAAHSLHLLGDIATQPDRFDAESGELQYRKALTIAEAHGMRPLVAHCHLGLGKVYHRTGRRQEAQAHLATATTMYRDMNMKFWLEQGEAESNKITKLV